ncbi:hypothetical protein SLEP1_g40423 [Rubroshorea leprosula]|uniref:DUF4219 domain-containing protein n=1 Tax=Rubroshorea leprosula TaxID=152421 RepID=A0AAV5L3C5_9ROSI|nr:hypothetical protein SLEP1_g40423 [Rubroshorea leprosula]
MEPSNFTPKTPCFIGQNYFAWSVKMKAYLRAFDLWDVVENDKEPAALLENPTWNQIKRHTEESTKRPEVQCRECKKVGHVERVYKQQTDHVQQAKVAEIVDEDEKKLFMASKVEKNCIATVNGDL